jgi:hypothetical protein
MSPVATLIAEIAAHGAALSRKGCQIVLNGASRVPPELKETIRARKGELVTHLAEERNRWD